MQNNPKKIDIFQIFKKIVILIASLLLGGTVVGSALWWINTHQKAESREDQILGWLLKYEPQPSTFSPDVTDRKFWKTRLLETKKIEPPENIPSTLDSAGYNNLINMGTDQELKFNTGEWIPAIEAALTGIQKVPWSERLQNQEFTDLHASQTAGNLARSIHALHSKLNPEVIESTIQTIRRKVTGPFIKDAERYQQEGLIWGKDMCPWLEGQTNWTAVCINHILYAILALEPDPKIRAHAIALAESPLDEYLRSAEEDGYLASGIRYWNYGFGSMMTLNERLAKATGNHIMLSDNEKVGKIGRFKENWLIWTENGDNYFPLFADNNNPTAERQWLDELCYRRFGTKPVEPQPRYTGSGGPFDDLMQWLPDRNPSTEQTPLKKESSYYNSAGALISRHSDGKTVLAAKAGSNQEEHNHNDVGSYTLFESGKYIAGDPGALTYTREVFSKARYETETLSSYGHPVPSPDNHLQTNSETARGIVLRHEITPEKDEVEYDLKHAYKMPGLTKLKRTITVNKTDKPKITVTDEFEAEYPIDFETAIITDRGTIKENEILMGDWKTTFKSNIPTERAEERFWRDQTPLKRIVSKTLGKAVKGKLSYTIEKK